MPIQFSSCESAECNLSEWSIGDPFASQLIDALAYLYLRQERNAQNIIEELETKIRPSRGRVAENVIRKLTAPDPKYVEMMKSGSQEEKETAEKMAAKEVVGIFGFCVSMRSGTLCEMMRSGVLEV